MRGKNVVRQAPQRVTGKFASVKNHRPVQWESRLERDAICKLEIDPDVTGYESQSVVVLYRLNGILREYHPDLKVRRARSQGFIEVKPSDEAQLPENQERFAEIARVLETEGFDFIVWTEKEIRQQPRLNNTKYLLRYRRVRYEHSQIKPLRELIERSGPLAISEALTILNRSLAKPTLFAMVCHGLIAIDHATPIGPDTSMSLVKTGASLFVSGQED